MEKLRRKAYRDGVESWTEGEIFTAPGGEIVEILYDAESGGQKSFFVELPGIPACAHGDGVDEAISAAREKIEGLTPLTPEEKKEYRAENYKFSVSLFRRLTRACPHGTKAWLKERGLTRAATMTIAEFRKAGGGQWANALEKSLQ
jgi:predicted RNase H-like HicB family nuclease